MFSAFANKKRLIGFITAVGDNFDVNVIDSISEKFLWNFSYKKEHAETFIDQFPTSHFENNIFKAFIIDLFGSDFEATPFKTNQNFCKALEEKFIHFEIPYYFIPEETYLFSSLLIATKIISNFDETVAIIIPHQSKFLVGKFKYSSNGYQLIEQSFLIINLKEKPQILRQKILGTFNPEKVVLASSGCKKFAYKKVFKSMNLILHECCLQCQREQFVIETCKWMLDKSYVKYHIIPTSVKSIHAYGCYGSESKILDILKINMYDPLPIEKTAYFTKSLPELYIVHEERISTLILTKELEKDCHKYKITVTVDENNLNNFKVTKLGIDNFEKFPSKIDVLSETKIPFIGFFDNSSVIAVYKENIAYQFLPEWNGQFGKEMFISFDEKKPKFGKAAMDVLKTKQSFVVFDLLKIMSMPSDNIQISKHWGFKIDSDAQNPVLIDFNNFCGARKAATPTFIMALFLRQHLKAIESEIGEKPKKIGLWIFKEFKKDEEMDRIQKGIGEACELLKIEYIFVDNSEALKLWDFLIEFV